MPNNKFASTMRVIAPTLLLVILFAGEFIAGYRRIEHGKRGDFPHFWYASRAMTRGEDPYTAWEGGYIYPPLVAFLYRPLVHVPEVIAVRVVLVINVALALTGLLLAAQTFLDRFDVAPAT